ncbi:MAG: ABC transporter substrate-binding protein [Chloroflexi bacterium]|nr:ABC transporter substrate-binding protein [Chloroflexota bacterium]
MSWPASRGRTSISRRGFLAQGAGVLLGTAVLAACSSPTPATPAAPTAAPTGAASVAATPTPAATQPTAQKVELTFFYPVGVAGPLSKIIDRMTGAFNDQQGGQIKVTPVYSGDYLQTLSKAQTALQAGKPPDVAVINAAAIFALNDMQAVVPLDDLAKATSANFVDDFFPAFLQDSRLNGSLMGVPFQRSTLVFYYNPDAFKAAGLDPKAPTTWDEVVQAAQKLVQRQGDTVTRWGVSFPSSGSAYWEFQALAIEAGQNVMGDAGNKVFFNTEAAVTALQWLLDLAHQYKVMASGVIDWGNLPTDFAGGKTAMMYHSTGSLSFVLKQANFTVGVAFDPKKKQYGSPTGGGNFYLFKGIPAANREAGWKFITAMTSPESLAQWSIDTGYVAPRKSCYDVPVYKEYTTKTPQALVARDQLQYAQRELGTHQMAQIQTLLSNAIQAALTGKQSPRDALSAAQAQADQILASFKD